MATDILDLANMNLKIRGLLNESASVRRGISSDRGASSKATLRDYTATNKSTKKMGFLDKFASGLEYRRLQSMRKNGQERSSSHISATSRRTSRARPDNQPKIDITSKHLQIEKRNFGDIQRTADLKQANSSSKYLLHHREPQPSKVLTILHGLERSNALGYDLALKSSFS